MKVSKNDVAIFVTDEELSAFSYEKIVKAKFVSIDLKTLTQAYLCSAYISVACKISVAYEITCSI